MLRGMLQISMTPSMKRVLEKVFLQSQSSSKNTKTIMTLKEKKMKCKKLSANSLESHSQALYSILLKPVIKSSPSWCRLHDDIKALADCLSHYKDFLNKKAKEIGNNHNLLHPVRTVAEFTSVEHRRSCRPCDHFIGCCT